MIVPTVTTFYVFGSYCNDIGISKRSEVRLCIRGSATVPTISFFPESLEGAHPYIRTPRQLYSPKCLEGAFSEVRGGTLSSLCLSAPCACPPSPTPGWRE